MSEEKTDKDRIVSERIPSILSDTSSDFSVRGLQKIHFLLFKGVSVKAGLFRNKFNPRKKEAVLQSRSVNYADSSEISILFEKIIFEEQSFDYSILNNEQKIKKLARFFSDLWKIHPFYDGNTRSITLFIIRRMRELGFIVDNTLFERNASYFRNCLVMSAYENRRISRDFSFLEKFLRNVANGVPISNLSSEILIIENPKFLSLGKFLT